MMAALVLFSPTNVNVLSVRKTPPQSQRDTADVQKELEFMEEPESHYRQQKPKLNCTNSVKVNYLNH